MISDLKLQQLKNRMKQHRLAVFYKVVELERAGSDQVNTVYQAGIMDILQQNNDNVVSSNIVERQEK